eukprot:CAMPEP_0177621544 /NCGR_PEP_ID=MMETSP0419_2-20121207/27642_1 /TAXON_ID=582737 /ORGANISM="Tetraselmis sp., Strain GSL018" /LENGTH=334 /DNA_ID=CAMNT_0019121469 /DNA_START=401 /DNA_END=1401 /DNA_ORIENTATION=+
MPSDAPHSRSGSSGGTAGPSCTEAPGEFARSLQEALATAKRDVSGVTAAQLRLGCAVLCTLAFGLGVWGASRSIVVASSWAAGLAGELAGSADNVLAYLVLFTYFQLVPALQEKVMLYGTPVAVTVRLLLCSAAAKGSAVLIALRATAAPLLLLLGWQSFASSSRPLRQVRRSPGAQGGEEKEGGGLLLSARAAADKGRSTQRREAQQLSRRARLRALETRMAWGPPRWRGRGRAIGRRSPPPPAAARTEGLLRLRVVLASPSNCPLPNACGSFPAGKGLRCSHQTSAASLATPPAFEGLSQALPHPPCAALCPTPHPPSRSGRTEIRIALSPR